LIIYILQDAVNDLGLVVIDGNCLERTNGANLSKELSLVKRNLTVDYGEFGSHLPDVDLVIYNPKTSKVIAVLSSKVTLRERIAQTGY
jgi:type II restriction enzyme